MSKNIDTNKSWVNKELEKFLKSWEKNKVELPVLHIPRNENQKDDVLDKEVNNYAESLDEIKKQWDQNSVKIEQTNTKVEYAIWAIVAWIISILVSHFLLWPHYQNEYRKEISEIKTEYNKQLSEIRLEYAWKISDQQNTINLQQEKIQNLEDDVKDLEDIVKKYFIK